MVCLLIILQSTAGQLGFCRCLKKCSASTSARWAAVGALTKLISRFQASGNISNAPSIARATPRISYSMPSVWSGSPTTEQKRETIDRIKTALTKQLPKLSTRRLSDQPQPVWHEAYSLRGAGSTFARRMRINCPAA